MTPDDYLESQKEAVWMEDVNKLVEEYDERNTEKTVETDSISPASGAQFALLPPDNATGNFTKVVQRIPVKIIFERESVQGYESRITPGMSAVVSVEVK
jgi:multidrug resistance efflux pump